MRAPEIGARVAGVSVGWPCRRATGLYACPGKFVFQNRFIDGMKILPSKGDAGEKLERGVLREKYVVHFRLELELLTDGRDHTVHCIRRECYCSGKQRVIAYPEQVETGD